jgi:glycosyltransferase involved in cell wall biosynthesis
LRTDLATSAHSDPGTTVTAGRKPHIAVVGHWAGDALFGAERSLLGILAAIDPQKYQVSCVLPFDNDAYLRAVGKYTSRITVLPYHWWSKSRPIDDDIVSRFESVFRDGGADIVHVNTITLIDPLVAARRIGVPSIVHARELIDQDDELAKFLGADAADVVRTICSAADFIIANSNATYRLYEKKGKSFCLYNSVDSECFDLPMGLEPGRLRVGLVSSNLPKKGIEAFVNLALTARRRSGLEFFVIGPPTEHADRLQERVRSRGGLSNLHFIGYVPSPAEAMRQVDVVVCLSTVAESFGRTIAEGMAAGRPVIAYNWGAMPELIRHGTDGYLIPYLSYEHALEHLETLLEHPEERLKMGRNGRERATQLFSPSVFTLQLHHIYRQILDFWKERGHNHDHT